MAAASEWVTETVRQMIDASGVSQNETARAMGYTGAWLSRKLSGQRSWSVDELDEVARHFGVAPAELLPAASDKHDYHTLALAA